MFQLGNMPNGMFPSDTSRGETVHCDKTEESMASLSSPHLLEAIFQKYFSIWKSSSSSTSFDGVRKRDRRKKER
eukprot:scaffold304_cov80-Skeletonema_menzelii.AAC.16